MTWWPRAGTTCTRLRNSAEEGTRTGLVGPMVRGIAGFVTSPRASVRAGRRRLAYVDTTTGGQSLRLVNGIADLVTSSEPIRRMRSGRKHEERPSWDEYGLILAFAAATRADCSRDKVGAALLNSRNETVGTGFNGAPAGVPGCLTEGACPRGKLSVEECPRNSDYSSCIADHAERGAIRHAPADQLPGSTIYVTRAPCPSCMTLIRAAAISRVVTPEGEV